MRRFFLEVTRRYYMKSAKKILVVGGGTAGWLSACFLQRALEKINPGAYEITLVESEDIGVIGVGEATVPTLVNTLKFLGISELEFMQKCNASFKHAIKFVGWLHEPGAEDNYYYHAFQRPAPFAGYDLINFWHSLYGNKSPSKYAHAVTPQADLCESNRCPKMLDSKPFEGPIGYAYHLDAVLFGRFLREKAQERGVSRVVGTIDNVQRGATGNIISVKTAEGDVLDAELFIDCSGFSGLLINKTLNTEFVSYSNELLCDRAIAIQVPTESGVPVKPYTTSTAMSSGWCWDIALQDRRGTGYVYSSNYISDEGAEKELRKYLGDASENLSARRLRMRVGRNKHIWNKNVVAIGLSAGFLEPLESSGIYLIEMGVKLLLDFFPHHGEDEMLRKRYNQHIAGLYDETMSFLVMHYCLTNREDTPFWKANKYHQNIPDSLQEDLEMWKYKMPSPFDRGGYLNFFNHETYQYVLAGMGRLPESAKTIFSKELLHEAEKHFISIRDTSSRAVSISPDHRYYLDQLKKYSVS